MRTATTPHVSGAFPRRDRQGAGQSSHDSPIDIRLSLQRRADHNVRRHLARAGRRFVVLLVADLGSFVLMRGLLRAVRDHAYLGLSLASAVRAILPRGLLSGSQFAVGLLVSLLITRNYGHGDERRDPRRLFTAAALAAALPLWTRIWVEGFDLVALQYVLVTIMVFAALLSERLIIDRLVAWVRPAGHNGMRTLFVGPAAECRRVMADAILAPPAEYAPVGFADMETPAAAEALGSIKDVAWLLQNSAAEVVIVCGHLADRQFNEVADAALLAGCRLLSVPRAIEVGGVQPIVRLRGGRPLIELCAPRLSGQQVILKRLLDICGAALGLALVVPLMALVALGIKLDSPGPVLFSQERIGAGGRRFRLFKFRTMYAGVSDAAHRDLVMRMLSGDETATGHHGADGEPVYKLVNDQRITGLGRFLRRTSLDELPQLINVVLGDMSLVGPRPPLPYECEAYDHWQFDRLRVRPGITGLWQVSGRNRLTYRQMCEMDVDYIGRWSLWLDLMILLRTVPVVLFNTGKAN